MMIRTALILMSAASLAPALHAALIFDRGLPTANANNVVVASRSNVAWGDFPAFDSTFSMNWTYGDDFRIGSSGQSYLVSSLRVWIVGDASGTPMDQLFSSLTLLGGTPGTTPSVLPACANTTGSNCFDPGTVAVVKTGTTGVGDIVVTPVVYTNTESYQNSLGGFNNIYQIDFNNLNWLVQGGTTYSFFVNGVAGTVGNGGNSPRLHASNGILGGAPAEGADDVLWELGTDIANTAVVMDSWTSQGLAAWDKNSDINVQVYGSEVSGIPEPSTMVLLGGALAVLGGVRRLRSRR